MRKVSISKARKFIESFGVRLNEDVNKLPISHDRDYISFRLTEEQHKQVRAGLSKWKPSDILVISEHWELWEVGSYRQVIGLTTQFAKDYEIYLKHTREGGQLFFG